MTFCSIFLFFFVPYLVNIEPTDAKGGRVYVCVHVSGDVNASLGESCSTKQWSKADVRTKRVMQRKEAGQPGGLLETIRKVLYLHS